MSWLLGGAVRQAQTPPTVAEPPEISDNSFLIEEAYNQERGVVQHISSFVRARHSGAWAYSFTQEWPVNAAPRNQVSGTLSLIAAGDGARAGVGDALIHWRYQVVSGPRLAIAPRASVILPTGSWRQDRGSGGVGVDVNLPVSLAAGRHLVAHWNVGATIVPRARDAAGDRAAATGVRVGQGLVWKARPRVNGMLEVQVVRQQAVIGSSLTTWETSVLVSPGVRWAYNRPGGLQIVPGVAVPIEVTRGAHNRWSVLLYLSFEHPFGSARQKTGHR